MYKYFHPRKGERWEHKQRRQQWLWRSWDPTEVSCSIANTGGGTASGGGRSLVQPSQRDGTLRGHLNCPAPSTSAAPHPSFPASSTTKAAHCCLVWCQPDMSSSKTHTGIQRKAGIIIPLGCPVEAPLQAPPPPAAPLVAIDAPLPGKPLVQPVKNVTWNSCSANVAWRSSLQPASRARRRLALAGDRHELKITFPRVRHPGGLAQPAHPSQLWKTRRWHCDWSHSTHTYGVFY